MPTVTRRRITIETTKVVVVWQRCAARRCPVCGAIVDLPTPGERAPATDVAAAETLPEPDAAGGALPICLNTSKHKENNS